MRTIVLKFGGASVATPAHFERVADIIAKRKKAFDQVVIVVSAMGDTTDQLISLAKEVNPDPPRREYDMLVTVGERISISLLAMALAKKGRQAVSFTGSQSGIVTTEHHSNAQILDVRPYRILPVLEEGKIVIVAGFQGVSKGGEITTLGRGGSDTTAVALGVALRAECVEFYKNVLGMYAEDPEIIPGAAFCQKLTHDEAMSIVLKGGDVLSQRCLKLAKKNRIPLKVRSFIELEHEGTIIDSGHPRANECVYEE